MRSSLISFLLCLTYAWPSPAQPFTPEEALKTFELDPNFRMEVFAAEPHIADPVVVEFDENGGVYVAELREMEVLPAREPGTKATIRLLKDTDGDGRMDDSSFFAGDLSFPTGLARYDGGLFALCTPDLLYLKDTDGDGKADIRKVVITGFGQGNAEHRFNNLAWGTDNWIYAANGHAGGKLIKPEEPDAEPLDLTNRDMRFSPWTGKVESVSRQLPGGFGLAFDDWGRKYVCHNESHVMHVVMPEQYLGRNPYLAVSAFGEDISDHGQPDAKIFPISNPQAWRIERTTRRAALESDKFRPTQLQVQGYFTAACGDCVYRAALFPEPYQGNLFVCDPANNLVHRDTLSEVGASMQASRPDPDTEFLRSTDSWFRPVNINLGPDGSLLVVDFYREIIETAASIPDDILAKLDLRAGADKGRIYRIVPKENKEPYRQPLLGNLPSKELVSKLSDGNAWVRLAAQRLLLERKAEDMVELLRALAAQGSSPLGRLHALWTLEGMGALDEATVMNGLDDLHPRIREQVLRLAEGLLKP